MYSILRDIFGHRQFRGRQQDIIERLVGSASRRDHVLALMPTGGGKSLCYQLPALMFEGGTLVVSPLIALMQDQVDALRRRNVAATFINSTVGRDDRDERLQAFVEGRYKLLYVTPERFRKPDFMARIQRARIDLMAVDEAHCISEWGHDFRPDYARLGEFRRMIGSPLTIALTATATPAVQHDILHRLGLDPAETLVVHQGIDRPNLRLEVCEIMSEREKIERIAGVFERYAGSAIVYFALISTLERFSQMLGDRGFRHEVYHGRLDAPSRKRSGRRFLSGEARLVLATNAFGMGVDKPDIRSIIHVEVPSSIESYYQEIGRAGRDGGASLCILLYDQEDLAIQMDFVRWSNPGAGFYARLYGLLAGHGKDVNQFGYDMLREELNFRNRRDFRLETALGMLDRWGVTEGSLDDRTLRLVGDLPDHLQDDEILEEKLRRDNMKLLAMVRYARGEGCRRTFISDYFGFPGAPPCGNCDGCDARVDD